MQNKEYTIFITCNGGKTYNLYTYNNFIAAERDLYNMVELEQRRHRPYYVYNDFFKNEYPASINCKIFCIKERFVTNWEIYSEAENNNTFDYNENNILKFPKRFVNFS